MINYSFIIPHKNCPNLLKRCVDSIPERDDIQIIVVDDNSDEDKKPSFERMGLETVYLDVEHSNGAGHARNVGLDKAEGKWLLFPDSDDYYVEGFMEIIDGYAEKEKDVVYFNFEYRNGNSGEILPPLHFSIEMADYDGSKKRAEAVRYHHNVPWTKMVKRELLDIHHIRFEEVPNGNDIFFSLMVGYFCYDSIEVIKKPLYVYLRNDNSITSKKATAYSSFCVIRHSIQLNRFYHFIGHNEWRWPTLKLILYHIKLCGIPFLYLLLRKTCYLINHREDWISILKKNG